MKQILIYGLGFLSQVLYFSRTIVQWFKSEHEGEVISPILYWQLSLAASLLLLTYGILRNDFSIVLGQFLVYFIYIRNLQLKNAWNSFPLLLRTTVIILPFIFFFWLLAGSDHNWNNLIKNKDIPIYLLIWGSAGQVTFSFRFIYQWITSESRKDSVLPLGFWIISSIGSLMILVYAILRLDPVLFISHSTGIFMYIRNILIYKGKESLFSKLNIPVLNRVSKKVSDRIK
jgi:lipid-A-disaccharide synthase-like uncharacterized protein